MAGVESLVSRWEDVAANARAATDDAARRAAVELRPADSLADIQRAAELLGGIWTRPGEPPVATELLRALDHSGNYVVCAHQDGRLVGALVGFLGRAHGEDHVHSHILGVRDDARVGGVGFALKLDQRAWALERGLRVITWTYDPLSRGNAFFNIAKLAAVGRTYHVNFYGDMPDVINDGDESDRVLVRWELDDRFVEAASRGTPQQPDVVALRARGAVTGLVVDGDGAPRRTSPTGDVILAQVPRDIVELRRTDPAAAMDWRRALRDVMTDAFDRGLRITGMTREGWYVLSAERR